MLHVAGYLFPKNSLALCCFTRIKHANLIYKSHFIIQRGTYYVALALPWTLTVMRGIQVPRNSKAACVERFPLTPPAPGLPCATPWVPEPEPPAQKIRE